MTRITEMQSLITMHFFNDNYAQYFHEFSLYYIAENEDKLKLIEHIDNTFGRFFDSWQKINVKIILGQQNYKKLENLIGDESSAQQNTAIEYYGQAYDIIEVLYQDVEHNNINCSYMNDLNYRIANSMKNVGFDIKAVDTYGKSKYFYDHYKNSQKNTMGYAYLMQDIAICNRKLEKFNEALEQIDIALNISKNNPCNLSSLYWDKYLIFDVIDGSDDENIPYYCNLLKFVLNYGDEKIFVKDKIAEKLLIMLQKLYIEDETIVPFLKTLCDFYIKISRYDEAQQMYMLIASISPSVSYLKQLLEYVSVNNLSVNWDKFLIEILEKHNKNDEISTQISDFIDGSIDILGQEICKTIKNYINQIKKESNKNQAQWRQIEFNSKTFQTV